LKAFACIAAVIALILAGYAAAAQAPPTPTPYNNIYAFGVSYNNASSPSVDGTALYARLVAANTSSTSTAAGTTTSSYPTYAFTALDILPVSIKPFEVSTNMSVGVAQRIFNFNNVNFFIPVSAGPAITGTNVGWNWTSGILADIPITKGGKPTNWGIMPNVRWLQTNINGGSVYQLTGGILIRLGQ
jgi:hypothetical protein